MKINKLDYIGLMLQEAIAKSSTNALELLLGFYDKQLQCLAAGASAGPDGANMFAIHDLITLPRDSVVHGLRARARNYVFTAPAREVIANIKVSRHLSADRIHKIKDRVYCLNFDRQMAAFVWKQDGDLKMIFTWEGKQVGDEGRLSSGMGTASLDRLFELTSAFSPQGALGTQEALGTQTTQNLKALGKLWRRVLQTLIFLELTDPEIQLVAAGKKHSERPLGTSNSTRQDVYVVNSTWNKYIVRVEGWGVRGHFRMQPCGVGRTELKLVWVTPHQKSGLTRSPQKPVEG